MNSLIAKLTIVVGVLMVVLPALAPLVGLDAGQVKEVIQSVGAVVASIGGLFHPVPSSPSVPSTK